MSTPNTEPTGATPAAGTNGATPAGALPVNTADAASAVAAALAAGTAPASPTNPAAPADPKGQAKTEPPKASDPAELLKDLTSERGKRQEAEARLTGVLKALGLDTDTSKQRTPEQIAEEAKAAEKAAQLELTAYRVGATLPTVNIGLLLDSRSFSDTLSKLDGSDQAAVKAAIVEYVKDKPQYLTGRPGAGTSDAAAGDPGAGGKSMDDLIRGR
jgi:hypothetical protein